MNNYTHIIQPTSYITYARTHTHRHIYIHTYIHIGDEHMSKYIQTHTYTSYTTHHTSHITHHTSHITHIHTLYGEFSIMSPLNSSPKFSLSE